MSKTPDRNSPHGGRFLDARYVAAFGAVALAIAAGAACAHDGGFGHSRRTVGFFRDTEGWTIEYRVRLSADEALVELARADADGDGLIGDDERRGYFEARQRRYGERLACRDAAGRPLSLAASGWELGPSLTQTYAFRMDKPADAFEFDDKNFGHKPGVVRIMTGPRVIATPRQPLDRHHAEHLLLRVAAQLAGAAEESAAPSR